MSIKIFNGYVFRNIKNIHSSCFFKKTKSLSSKIVSYQKNKIIEEFYIDHFKDITNNKDFFDFKINSYDLHNFYSENTSFVVFPKIDKKTYCMIFSDFRIKKLISKTFNLKEFPYYNNTDKPTSYNKRRWKINEKKWNTILNNYHLTPNQAGVSFQLTTNIYDVTKEDFDKFFNNTEIIKHLRLKIHKNNFIIKEHKEGKKIPLILKEYALIDQKTKESESNLIDLPYLKFPDDSFLTVSFDFYYNKNIPVFLNDFIENFNNQFHIELENAKNILFNKFKNYSEVKTQSDLNNTFLYYDSVFNEIKMHTLEENKLKNFNVNMLPIKDISLLDIENLY